MIFYAVCSSLSWNCENREVDTTIHSVTVEARERSEVVIFRVFEYEYSPRSHDFAVENGCRYLSKIWHIVWRVSKNEVERLWSSRR